jgi:hypothetical protein
METMSGLDGLGWPNPEDEPKPKTMNDTPETDGEWNRIACYDHPQFEQGIADFSRKLERERDEWKAKYIQQNKDLGCELRDPNGTIWDHAKTLQRERDEARGQIEANHKAALVIERMVYEAREQRDRLIKSVEPLKYWRDISECDCSNPLPQGGCLRCDLNRILKTTNPNEL